MLNYFLFIYLYVSAITNGLGDRLPMVQTSLGKIVGYYRTSYDGRKFSAFEGIPYAEPPIGDLRFEAPKPIRAWNEILNATSMYKCKQLDNEFNSPHNGNGSEDCLYLNVYVPKTQPSINDNFDVIVHIHGGGFMVGDAYTVGPSFLIDRDVIYVSLNYRLGILGFLSTEDTVVPGNNGLKDQQLALKWVQKYIRNFGGNRKSITLMGLSAGGASVHFHYFSPKSKGLFHRGISQSGTAIMPWTIQKSALEKTRKLAVLLNCQNSNNQKLINCLKKVSVDELVAKTNDFYIYKEFPIAPFGPVVEVESKFSFLTKHPYKQLEDGEMFDVPWLSSITRDEGIIGAMYLIDSIEEINKYWNKYSEYLFDYEYTVNDNKKKETSDKIKSFYFQNKEISENTINLFVKAMGDRYFNLGFEEAVKMQAKVSNSPVYAEIYAFDKTTIGIAKSTGLNLEGVCHADDALFLHDSSVVPLDGIKFSKSEEYIKNLLLDFVTSFVKDGVPKSKKIIWERMIPDNSNYLYIHDVDYVKMTKIEEIAPKAFWNSLDIMENSKLTRIRDEL